MLKEWRLVARIEDLIVGRQFRRYGIGSFVAQLCSDWARKHGCWAILLETQKCKLIPPFSFTCVTA